MAHPIRFLKLKYRRWQINRALRILDGLDWHMKEAGFTRTERRQFWREFIKKQEFRTGVFNELTWKGGDDLHR